MIVRACEQSQYPAIDRRTSRALYLAIFWACDQFAEQALEIFFGMPCLSSSLGANSSKTKRMIVDSLMRTVRV